LLDQLSKNKNKFTKKTMAKIKKEFFGENIVVTTRGKRSHSGNGETKVARG
jgi:hypothetical protein